MNDTTGQSSAPNWMTFIELLTGQLQEQHKDLKQIQEVINALRSEDLKQMCLDINTLSERVQHLQGQAVEVSNVRTEMVKLQERVGVLERDKREKADKHAAYPHWALVWATVVIGFGTLILELWRSH